MEKAKDYYDRLLTDIDREMLPPGDLEGQEETIARLDCRTQVNIQAIRDFCSGHEVAEIAFFHAAFAYTLTRFTGREDAFYVTFYDGGDASRSGETDAVPEAVFPILLPVQSSENIADFVSEAGRNLRSGIEYAAYSFEELAHAHDIAADLFFIYKGEAESTDVEREEYRPAFFDNVKPQIKLEVRVKNGEVGFVCEYRGNRYSDSFIKSFLDSLKEAVKEFLSKKSLSEVSLLSREAEEKLDSFNATEVPYDKSRTVVSLFRKAVTEYPNRTALIFSDRKYSYAEVDELSEKIAAFAAGKGLGRGDAVSVFIPRNEYMFIASLGVLKAGCAYQPLDTTYPAERLNFMARDSSAKLLITTEELRPILTEYSGEVLYLEDIPSLPVPNAPVEAGIRPEDTFILLYTSGSTGIPKGVKLTHKNLVCNINWYQRYFDLTEEDCIGEYASYGFDAHMFGTYAALSCGGSVCIVPEESRLDLLEINAFFERNHVTHAFMTTQVGRQFAVDIENHSLKVLTVGGEKLVTLEPPSNYDFINIYGPTETTILVTAMKVEKAESNIPIGKAVDNMKLYIVDKNFHRLPIGGMGELIIAGPQVGAGYMNQPEKTSQVFITNPFEGGEYEHAYRTGDIVRYRPDGYIEFIGRRDGQVKVRGFRIEMTEVEAVLREYPGVQDATVAAFDHPSGGKFIAAYVVGEKELDAASIADFIRERKPPYMVPSTFTQLDMIPLTQNGKVNRRALPVPELFSAPETEADSSVPANLMEKALREILEELTGRGNMPLCTPLERAGVSSIGFIRLAALIYKRFGVSIPIRKFKGATLLGLEDELWAALMSRKATGAAEQAKSLEKTDENLSREFAPYPLGAAQLGVYMECMKKPESTIYNIPLLLEFSVDTDENVVASAIRRVMKAHPSIHVHFCTVDNRVMVVGNEEKEISVRMDKMTDTEYLAFKEHFPTPFKLDSAPLYFFSIVRTEKALYLFMDFHHLVFDGFSLDLFMRDFAMELRGISCAHETMGYEEFVKQQQELLAGEAAKEFEAYFKELFADYDSPSRITPDLPQRETDSTEQPALVPKPGIIRTEISQGVVDRALRRTGVSEAAFFLAGIYYVTARVTGSDRVYISTISSGRSDAGVTDTYGMFVNTLPLTSKLGTGTVDEYIKGAARDLDTAVAHEEYPFALLADEWGYSVELMYAYQRGLIGGPEIPGLVSVDDGYINTLRFPIDVQVIDGKDGPVIEIIYDASLYSERFMEKFGRYLRTCLERFAEKGDALLRSISLVDDEEMRLLEGFHTVPEEVTLPENTFFFTAMEQFAREYPERTALIAKDGTFTYREFDTITDRVANALIKRGAKVGDRALILLPRTSRAIFAFYGASKAGMGYIPFDPSYPEERVNMVIEDSNARFVITTADMLPRFADKSPIDVEELLLETDDTKPHVPLTQEDISYFIYTSGSTGRPKGVMLTHGGIAHYVANMPNKEMVNALRDYCSVYACITTLSFDMSVMGYSLALSNGLTVYFASEEECNNADLLAARMMETKADVISDVPSRIYTLLGSEAFRNALKTYCKLVICGGEKYSEKLMNSLKEVVPHPMNIYGPSEITISCNEHELSGDEIITVGRPTPGVTEYVVDTDGNELPIGVVGEIYIGGWGVGAGYNNLPEVTAEKFITYRGERVYKSGDYGRWRDNGYLEIIGRKDNQIKLRGLRIELDEVENVLAQQPGMRHTAVKIEKLNGIEHLCAWFTNEEKVDIPALKEALGKTLTAYMVPTAYMQMETMPFTPNGKLDLKNLPVPEIFRAGGEEARTKAEKDFCSIFSALLNVPDVLATESFFELGGTSLLVTKVVIEAGKLGYNIVFGDVFQHPTPRALAALLEEDTEVRQQEQIQDREVEDYDYSEIDALLKQNTLEAFKDGKPLPLGNVLLTGATGYLGIHILHELLENTDSKVYCMLRSKRERRAEHRLQELCYYYFENAYRELAGKRLFVVDGDVTDYDDFDELNDCQIDTVINCAASVTHFAYDTRIEDINVGGAKNVIDFCLAHKARMIQTSTMSVLELGYKDDVPPNYQPTEQTLYFGQDLTNKYVHSKFLAERAVLEAVVKRGLSAKIMRYGNLSARAVDGEFQINFTSNAAMGVLKGYAALGCASYDRLNDTMEFSPIDVVAKATVALAKTPEQCRIFHVITDQYIPMVQVFREMEAMGHPVAFVEPEAFAEAFAKAQSDPEIVPRLTSLMAYAHGAWDRERVLLDMNREYTLQVLYRLGLPWPVTSWDYLRNFMRVLNGLGFFDEE